MWALTIPWIRGNVENKEGGGPGVVAGAESQSINPISRLIQIQQARKEKEPVYILVAERGMPRRREFVMQVSVSVGREETQSVRALIHPSASQF